MGGRRYNLVLLFQDDFITESDEKRLCEIILLTETDESFCTAHELVVRNYITRKSRVIIKETRKRELKPFRFLINKN